MRMLEIYFYDSDYFHIRVADHGVYDSLPLDLEQLLHAFPFDFAYRLLAFAYLGYSIHCDGTAGVQQNKRQQDLFPHESTVGFGNEVESQNTSADFSCTFFFESFSCRNIHLCCGLVVGSECFGPH